MTARYLAYGGLFAALALGFVVTTHGWAPSPAAIDGSAHGRYQRVDVVRHVPAAPPAALAAVAER